MNDPTITGQLDEWFVVNLARRCERRLHEADACERQGKPALASFWRQGAQADAVAAFQIAEGRA